MEVKDTKEYNGWTNWATWNAALWFNNDEYLYRQAKQVKNQKELKVLFNSEIEVFSDFRGKKKEINNINWQEVFEGTGDRG